MKVARGGSNDQSCRFEEDLRHVTNSFCPGISYSTGIMKQVRSHPTGEREREFF